MKLLDYLIKYPKGLLILCFLLSGLNGLAQCNFKHEVKIEHSQNLNDGQIQLSITGSSESIELKLYIVYNSEIKLVNQKTFRSGSNSKVTFDKLQPGLYYLVAKGSSCELSIGGIEGLTVNQTER
jgi:hypothetical protein